MTTRHLDGSLRFRKEALKKEDESLKKEKATLKKEKESSSKSMPLEKGRKPWVKIYRTIAKQPARAYLRGYTAGERTVSATRCPDHYIQIIDEIWEALEKDAMTKGEAKELREKTVADMVAEHLACTKHPWKRC